MITDWKWRIYLFVRAVDATQTNKNALAQIYVDGESGETLGDEAKLLNSVSRFSMSGEEPAQVFGINLTAKTSMRNQFKDFLDTLTNARYAVVANTNFSKYKMGELVLTNFPVTPNGQIVSWGQAKTYLFNQFGLQEIPEPEADSEALL